MPKLTRPDQNGGGGLELEGGTFVSREVTFKATLAITMFICVAVYQHLTKLCSIIGLRTRTHDHTHGRYNKLTPFRLSLMSCSKLEISYAVLRMLQHYFQL